jgi:hypothetical protein
MLLSHLRLEALGSASGYESTKLWQGAVAGMAGATAVPLGYAWVSGG